MNTVVNAYQYALSRWQAFHAATSAPSLGESFWEFETSPPEEISNILRCIPIGERTPVAFGVFFKGATRWSHFGQTMFLGEFLSNPSQLEQGLLETAARGALRCPDRLPVTVDEFPSRIWQRAQATRSPARLVAAACLAVKAMARLLDEHADGPVNVHPGFNTLQPGESMDFQVLSGDLPAVLDLVALTPTPLKQMKLRVLEKIETDILAGRLPVLREMLPAISAWILTDDPSGHDSKVTALINEARGSAERLAQNCDIHHIHHTRRLGRLMFRLGKRGAAIHCAKAIGHSAWEQGWQHQVLANASHTRIRNAINHKTAAADTWLHDPALACSAMSRPLWLGNTISRLPELMALFTRAADFPWIFPRLHDLFQWHLALADKPAELRAVEALAPDLAVGLSSVTPIFLS